MLMGAGHIDWKIMVDLRDFIDKLNVCVIDLD
jgi:hypothetical protein